MSCVILHTRDYAGRMVEQVQMVNGVKVGSNVVFMQKRKTLPRRARKLRSKLAQVFQFRPVESSFIH